MASTCNLVYIPPLIEIMTTDQLTEGRPTDRQTNQKTDRPRHEEDTW